MTTRTLLPTWKNYRVMFPFTKEPFESFEFIKNESLRKNYILLKNALDSIPGSREYLRNHTTNVNQFFNDFGPKILSHLELYTTRDSLIGLIRKYKYLLNMWDNFVEDIKSNDLRNEYILKQIHPTHINKYAYVGNNPLNAIKEAEKIKNIYNLTGDISMIIKGLNDLVEEQHEEYKIQVSEELCKQFEKHLLILGDHYKNPTLWKNSTFGSPNMVTEEMIVALEAIYPDYRAHIKAIQNNGTTT